MEASEHRNIGGALEWMETSPLLRKTTTLSTRRPHDEASIEKAESLHRVLPVSTCVPTLPAAPVCDAFDFGHFPTFFNFPHCRFTPAKHSEAPAVLHCVVSRRRR
jgi:hypothetical protein